MIAMAPMLSAILGAIFLKEMPDSKTWIAIGVTFIAAIYIFYDSLQLGNIFGDLLGLVCALGLAVGAVTIRSAKTKNLVPAAVVGKLLVAAFAIFFIETYALVGRDLLIVPLMCVMCVAIPFVLVTIAPRFIPAEEVNLFFSRKRPFNSTFNVCNVCCYTFCFGDYCSKIHTCRRGKLILFARDNHWANLGLDGH